MWGLILKLGLWLLGRLTGGQKADSAATEARAAGSANAVAQGSVQAAKATEAQAQAVVDAPQTQAGVVGQLQKGEF